MPTMLLHLLLFVVPAFVYGHGCSYFRLADDDLRERFMSDDLVPTPIKEFVTALGTNVVPFGVYDCHDGTDEYEVGYTAACIDDGTCMCTALYNSVECRSCELACGADIENLDKGSFRADCSNVQTAISETCTVECDYTTYDCFVGDPPRPTSGALWWPLSFAVVSWSALLVSLGL